MSMRKTVSRMEGKSIATGLQSLGAQLLICDMAGTTVNEHGLVYTTLRASLVENGLDVSEKQMSHWHGASKSEVIAHFVDNQVKSSERQELKDKINEAFTANLIRAYFDENSKVELIGGNRLLLEFELLRQNDIKVALNTG